MGAVVSRFLLDTHALLWWLDGDERLGSKARVIIENPENHIYVSAVSAWEIETKFRIGKLPLATGIIGNFESVIKDQGFFSLSISMAHAAKAGALPGPHRDPFDRMLIAQAQLEEMILLTNDRAFSDYEVDCLW